MEVKEASKDGTVSTISVIGQVAHLAQMPDAVAYAVSKRIRNERNSGLIR